MKDLPANLSPLYASHPASCAYRITMSPHEWEWSQSEQEAIASALVQLDIERNKLEQRLTDFQEWLRETAANSEDDSQYWVVLEKLYDLGEPIRAQC